MVSDVKFLAAETRRLGMGEVFISEDVESFVEAVKKVSADKARYIAAYNPALLQERSWEAQSERLVPVYESLTHLQGVAQTPSVFKLSEPDIKPATESMKDFFARILGY